MGAMDQTAFIDYPAIYVRYPLKEHRFKSKTIVIIVFLLAGLQRSTSQETSRIRLLNGATPNEGRVEVDLGDGRGYGTVCDIGWDYSDAAVVCKQLGYPAATYSTKGARYGGNPALPILLENVACKPSHTAIEDCPAADASASCDHTNDGGVKCMIPGFLGCFSLLSGGSRAWTTTENSNDECIAHCKAQGHRYAGMSGSICRCGSIYRRYVYAQLPDHYCNANCEGDPTQLCGHPVNGYYSVFDTTLGICEDPGIPKNGNRSGDNFAFGSTVSYTCDDDYVIRGDPKLQCVLGESPHDVQWSGRPPICVQSPNRIIPTTPPFPGITNSTVDDVTTGSITSSDSSNTIQSNQNISSGSIAGISVVMVLITVACIVLIGLFLRKKREKKDDPSEFHPETLSKKSDSVENVYDVDEPNVTESETRIAPSLANYNTVDVMPTGNMGNGHISRTLPSIHLYMDVTVPEDRISPTSDYGTVLDAGEEDIYGERIRTPGDGIEETDQPDSEQRVYFVLENSAPNSGEQRKNQRPKQTAQVKISTKMGQFKKKSSSNCSPDTETAQNTAAGPISSNTTTEYSSTSVVSTSEDVSNPPVEGSVTARYMNSEFHEEPKNLIDNVLYKPASFRSKVNIQASTARVRNNSDSEAPRKSIQSAAPDPKRRRSTGEPKRSHRDSLMSACYVNTEFHAIPENMVENELYKPCKPAPLES